jgi:uncharacterized protein YbaR (Trm112 family)
MVGMLQIKSLLEWWRLITGTILTLPFLTWSENIGNWLKSLPSQWLSILVGMSLTGSFVCLMYLLKLKKDLSNKLVLRYGIYWDKNRNPHCPVCKIPVSYNSWSNGSGGSNFGYYCPPCKHIYPLSDETGKYLKPEEILSKI